MRSLAFQEPSRWGWKDKRELITNARSAGFKVDLGASACKGTSGFRKRMCSDLPSIKSSRQPARLEPGRPARRASRQCRGEGAVAARSELDHRHHRSRLSSSTLFYLFIGILPRKLFLNRQRLSGSFSSPSARGPVSGREPRWVPPLLRKPRPPSPGELSLARASCAPSASLRLRGRPASLRRTLGPRDWAGEGGAGSLPRPPARLSSALGSRRAPGKGRSRGWWPDARRVRRRGRLRRVLSLLELPGDRPHYKAQLQVLQGNFETAPGNLQSTFCPCELASSRSLIYVLSVDRVPGTVLGAGDVTGKSLTVWSSHPRGGRQSKGLKKSEDFRSASICGDRPWTRRRSVKTVCVVSFKPQGGGVVTSPSHSGSARELGCDPK
ncbi:uncharacterized protein LOC120584948 [Pteropus medius]|uniref:uncharacterized protein LOC120584948 n=1 Tax=Pteropus vampyrus TaxID=132908 RepID=UPI00196B054A|nr:uncharacterized protein LOC120584948 [Pteropus giganteus]